MSSDVAAAAEVSQSVLPARCACRKHRTRTAVHKLGAVNEGQHDAKVQICDRLAVPVPLLRSLCLRPCSQLGSDGPVPLGRLPTAMHRITALQRTCMDWPAPGDFADDVELECRPDVGAGGHCNQHHPHDGCNPSPAAWRRAPPAPRQGRRRRRRRRNISTPSFSTDSVQSSTPNSG